MSRRIALAGLALGLAVAPRAARADDAAARILFEQGVALMEAKDYGAACPKIDEALRLDPTAIGGTLQSARCHEAAGHLATAWARYRDTVELASRRGDERAAEASSGVERLGPRLGRTKLSVPPELGALKDVTIRRDGELVPRGLWDSPFPMDAGSHQFEVEAPGYASWSTEIAVADGAITEVRIPVLVRVEREATPTPGSAASGAVPERAQEGPRVWPWVTLVAGVAAAGGAVGFGVGWSMTNAEFEEACTFGVDAEGRPLCRPVNAAPEDVFDETGLVQEGQRLENQRVAFAGLTIGLSAAAVGLAAATIVGFVSGDEPSTVAITPWVGPTEAGLVGRWAF